jgi:hypothetical protein
MESRGIGADVLYLYSLQFICSARCSVGAVVPPPLSWQQSSQAAPYCSSLVVLRLLQWLPLPMAWL